MTRLRLGAALACLLAGASAGASQLAPFRSDDWTALRAAHADHSWIVHIWGISCDPCRQELPTWAAFLRRHAGASVTFIEAEQASPQAVAGVLADAGLAGTDQRLDVDGMDETTRYAIDPRWGGELPLTLLVAANGHVEAVSGAMDFRRLEAWLMRNARVSGSVPSGGSATRADHSP